MNRRPAKGDVSAKWPEHIDGYLARIWSNHAKLGVTLEDLRTVYTLEDAEQMYDVLDVYDLLEYKARKAAQG